MKTLEACLAALPWAGHASAQMLFHGGTVIAYNVDTSSLDVIRNGSVLVENDRITQVFEGHHSTISLPQETEMIDISGKILTPGFVDTHHHLWQSLFKTMESNTSLATYFALFGENGMAEKSFRPQDNYISQLGGALESLNAGVTTIVDHAHGQWSNDTVDAIVRGNIESGARIYYGYAIHNLANGWTIAEQIQKYRALSRGSAINTDLISLGIAFDFFSSATPAQVRQVVDLAFANNASFITSHYVGGPFLIDNSPEVLDQYGVLNSSIPVILSHAAYITSRGRELLRQRNQYIATTPESELQLLFDTHNATRLIQDQASLGVDTNFGFTADILTQARIWLQRLRGLASEPVHAAGNWPATSPMSVNQAFLLATLHGGLALKRPDIGVIARGAKADLVIFDTTSPSFLGWNDPVAAIILHAGIGDIEAVLVDGQFRKRDGKLTHSNYTAVVAAFEESAARVQQRVVALPQFDFVGQKYLNSTPYATVPQVDTLSGAGTGYGVLQVSG